ncbi:MAG: hypothetical protein EPN84_09515 [Legionella sp.]|nr:MAG: hypothetical protein EPN84_09515 [Legionella sp.]
MTQLMMHFTDTIKTKKYDELKKLLNFMTYEKEFDYFDNGHENHAYDLGDSLLINDWTPLAIAATCKDPAAMRMILARWNSIDLVKRSYTALDTAIQQVSEYSHPVTYISLSDLQEAKALLLYVTEELFPDYSHCYTKSEKEYFSAALQNQLSAITKVDELIAFYQLHINRGYISYHRNPISSFFASVVNYPNSKIHFIESLQKKALLLISNLSTDDSIVSMQCECLMESGMFSSQHYDFGVGNPKIREVIEFNQAKTNTMKGL